MFICVYSYRGFVPLINLFLKWLSASTHESKEILYKDIYKVVYTYVFFFQYIF